MEEKASNVKRSPLYEEILAKLKLLKLAPNEEAEDAYDRPSIACAIEEIFLQKNKAEVIDKSCDTSEDIGIIGEGQIKFIRSGLPFWTDVDVPILKRMIERSYKPDVIRTHGISGIVIHGDTALLKFYKRHRPLSDEELIDMGFLFKTSEDWMKTIPEDYELVVLDPDGWDRTNFEHSFNVELITQEEFKKRLNKSTIQCNVDFSHANW